MKKLFLLSLVILSVMVFPLASQTRQINYQGNLLDQQDKPLQGPVQMTFEFYDKEFGGTQLWSEIQNVTLNKGYFNVLLGSTVPFAPDFFQVNKELWVQVTVGNAAPYKRQPITSVPVALTSDYSLTSKFAEDVPDNSITLVKLADEVKIMGGDLTGLLPNPRLRPGAALANIEDGSITQEKLSPNISTRPSGAASGDLTGWYPDPLIAEGAVKTNRIADYAVTTEKLALGSITLDRLYNPVNGAVGTIIVWDGTKWIESNVPAWEIGKVKNVIAGEGTYVNYTLDADGFIDATVGIADDGVTTSKIADQAVTYAKLQNAVGPVGTILNWDGTNWVETTVGALELDGVIGNEVLDATAGRGLVRAGLGTDADPYTLGIADDGVVTQMIADKAITLPKIANGAQMGQVMWYNHIVGAWQLSASNLPAETQVLKWVSDGAGSFIPTWANDEMTLPFSKVMTNPGTLFQLTNDADAPVMELTGRPVASTGLYGISAVQVINDASGRGLTVVGGTSNDQDAGLPFRMIDNDMEDDAALVVANQEYLNGGVYPAFTTAIRAFGDVWVDGRIGAREGIFDSLYIKNLNVVKLTADTVITDILEANLATIDSLALNFGEYHLLLGDSILTDFIDADHGIINTLESTTGTITTLTSTTGTITNLSATNGTIDNLTVNNSAVVHQNLTVDGELDVKQDVHLNTDGGIYTTYMNRLDVTNDGVIGSDLLVGNDLNVANNAEVGNDLKVNANANISGALTLGNKLVLSNTVAVDLAALNFAITNGFTVIEYTTANPMEANLVDLFPAGTVGQVIYIYNNTTVGDITLGTVMNPVTIKEKNMTALIYIGTSWIPMSNN